MIKLKKTNFITHLNIKKLQLTKANTYNIKYKLYQLFRAPNMSINIYNSYNLLKKPTILYGKKFERGFQGLCITQ